jgi:hypothetical protein
MRLQYEKSKIYKREMEYYKQMLNVAENIATLSSVYDHVITTYDNDQELK